jgi:hypothetical protein
MGIDGSVVSYWLCGGRENKVNLLFTLPLVMEIILRQICLYESARDNQYLQTLILNMLN